MKKAVVCLNTDRRVAIDCANGAGYKSGPKLLKSLGAKVYNVGTSPNGLNINKNCGSTFPKKIKSLVVENYNGNLPITFRLASQLDDIELQTPTWATPTIIFLEQGKEVFGHQGYMSPQEFYKALGFFKLGDSEAYRVAFEEGTDARFCKEYEIFKNTPDGIFVDKLSGAPLFDTRDRFNSGTGWLSFTKPVDGSVYRRADNSYGMRRIEIRSKTSDIHLGHVFPDGPNGLPRYCINATVLEFKNRNEIDKS